MPESQTGTLLAADLPHNMNAATQQAQTTSAMPKKNTTLRLLVADGPHVGQEFSIFSLPAQIGRIPEAAVRLDQDLGISRQHAEIYEQDGELRIRDLNSAHGTRLGSSHIQDERLNPGDLIQVGVSTLVVQISEGGH